MKLANKITLTRIIITPIFYLVFQATLQTHFALSAAITQILLIVLLSLFGLSELSDLLDGIIARKNKEVSSLGKLLDPFGDIFSRITYFFCFYQASMAPSYVFILILWREVSMLFIRQLVQLYGLGALPARWSGKVKAACYTLSTMIALLLFSVQTWTNNDMLESTPTFLIFQNWVLPITFLMAIYASWYSFYLYFRDFLVFIKNKKLET